MTDLLFILLFVFAGTLYVLLFGLLFRPVASIYGYIVAWIVFPNGGLHYVNIAGLTLHALLEPFLAVAVLLALLRAGRLLPSPTHDSRLRTLLQFALLVLGVQYTAQLIAYMAGSGMFLDLTDTVSVTDRVNVKVGFVFAMGAVSNLSILVFAMGTVQLLRRWEHLERVMLLLFLLSCELVVELILFKFLQWPSVLLPIAFHPQGAFNSLILNNYAGVAGVSASGLVAGIYLSRTRRWKGFQFLTPLFVLPIIYGLERTPLVAIAFALVYLFYTLAPGSAGVRRLGSFVGVATVLILIAAVEIQPAAIISSAYSGTYLEQRAWSLSSVFTRFGLQLRTMDIIAAKAPLGVGGGMVPYYLSSKDIPSRFVPGGSAAVDVAIEYDRAQSGDKATTPHNLYLEKVAEFGPLAAIGLVLLGGLLLSRWNVHQRLSNLLRTRTKWPSALRNKYLLVTVSWGAILYFALFYLMETTPNLYVMYWCFIRAVLFPIDVPATPQHVSPPRSPAPLPVGRGSA